MKKDRKAGRERGGSDSNPSSWSTIQDTHSVFHPCGSDIHQSLLSLFHGLQVETSMHCKEFFMSWHQCHLSPPVASLLFHQYICPISIWSYSRCSICFSAPFLPSRGSWLWQAFTSPQFPLACGIRRYLQLHFLSDILSSSKFGSPSLSLQLFAYTFPVWMTSWYPR